MYQPMLYLHWKQIRLVLIPLVLASFGLPLLAVAGLGASPGMSETSLNAFAILDGLSLWLPFFPALAGAIGVILALSAWNWDHRLGHVYALSLPVTRMEYTLLKMGAGGVLTLLPATAMWLGAHVAAASVALPAGLHTYPDQLAIRFLLASLIAYSVLFAMAAGTVKTTVWIVGIVAAFLLVGLIGTDLLILFSRSFERTDIVGSVIGWLLDAPGPFEVFTGNWSLIDV
jgi:hypothetical protein